MSESHSPAPVADSTGSAASPYTPSTTAGASKPLSQGSASLLFNFIVPLVILAVAVGAFLLFGKQAADEKPDLDGSLAGQMQRLPVATVQPVRSLDEMGGMLNLAVDGVVVPFREVEIATEVAGTVVYKDPLCEAGNYVEAGQLLCRIDSQDYELDVQRLSRMLEQEYESLKEIDQEMANAKRLLDVASEDLALREKEVKRLQSMPAGFASETELDAAQRARLQALQTQVGAQNQLDLLGKRRSRLEASERLATVQLEVAKLNLQRTEIRSQVSGVIVNEDAELNSFVQRGSPIITIEDTSQVEVAVNLRMDQLHWVLDQRAESDPATLPSSSRQQGYQLPNTRVTVRYEVSGREGDVYEWDGELLRYDGIGLDPQTRTAPVRVIVKDPKRFQTPGGTEAFAKGPSALLRGMFVTVVLHIEPRTPLVLIPSLAMQPGGRVWKFSLDPTVLQTPPSVTASPDMAVSSGTPVQTVANTTDSSTEKTDDSPPAFDIQNWKAGRVVVLDKVRPIESVMLPALPRADADQPAETMTKYWVCEAAGQLLEPGNFVVTSPLSAVSTDDPLPVRVDANEVDVASPVAVTAQR